MRADILKCAREAQVRAATELQEHLHLMVDEPAFSDVVFVCKDAKRVHASRMLLAARSPVFKNMFMNGMVESRLSEIELPEILSPALLSVFEFLYTGNILDDHLQSWRMACEVITASRFFLLTDLEMIVKKYMRNQISIATKELTTAASLLTEALEFNALFDKTDGFLGDLVKILSSNWSDSSYVRNLSHLAFQYLLVSTKGNYDDDGKFSFKEYFRFRQVIRWWVHRNDFWYSAPEEFVNFLVPNEKRAKSLCRNPSEVDKVESPSGDVAHLSDQWNSFQLEEASRNSAIGLLSNIDYRRIHPVLLAKVVEPLKVISTEEIQKTFRFHALRRPLILVQDTLDWEHGESYRTLEKGYVIHRCGTKTGLAVMKAAISPSSGVYQWHFVLEKVYDYVTQVGFIYYSNRVGAEKSRAERSKLDNNRLSDLDCARVLRFKAQDMCINWAEDDGRTSWKFLQENNNVNQRVCFEYDSCQQICSLSIDGQCFGVIWKNLPEKNCYPAVSLGCSSEGRVRIDLVSGFDSLST